MHSFVNNYKMVLASVAEIIDVSGYKNEYLARKMGLTPSNFSAKKRRVAWSPDEVQQLLSIAMNEDVEDYMLLKEMESTEKGETMTMDEFETAMGWK